METLKGIFQCPQQLTNVIQTSQNSPWLSLRSLNKWYGVFAPQYYKFSQVGSQPLPFCICFTLVQRKTRFDEGESASGRGGFLRFGACFGLVGFAWFWSCLCSFPPHHVVFPSPSMMTWALRPHGVRGKKKEHKHHARIGPRFTSFTRACRQQETFA